MTLEDYHLLMERLSNNINKFEILKFLLDNEDYDKGIYSIA